MAIDDKIRDKKLRSNINSEAANMSALPSEKIDKYEQTTGGEILSSNQKQAIEHTA